MGLPQRDHEFHTYGDYVSCVTLGRSREFSTPLGVFSFQRVPTRSPRAGVEAVAVAPACASSMG